MFVCWLLIVPATCEVYLRDGSAQTILRAATLRIEAADQTFHLTQSQYTDTGPTSPSANPITPGAWQGSHWECQFLSHWQPPIKLAISPSHSILKPPQPYLGPSLRYKGSHSRTWGGTREADDRQVKTVFTVSPSFPPSALDKPSIMKRYHRRRTTR